MCHKLCKKFCCMFLFAALMGGVLYLLGCLRGKDMDDEIIEEIKDKKEKLKSTGAVVKNAMENIKEDIKEDVKDMKDSAEAIFENGENA